MARNSGMNDRPFDEAIAGTGPGIADEALAPGESMPEAPSDEEVARIAEKLGVSVPEAD